MLKILKKLFQKEKEIETIELNFSELPKWLEAKSKPFEQQLNQDINHILEEIKTEKQTIIEKVTGLKDSKLQNPNISSRAKTVMEGNRDAFIRSITRFYSDLNISFQDLDQIVEECKKVRKEMDNIAESTARSYAILNQFFARELGSVTEHIKKIDNYLKDITNLVEDNTLTKVNKIRAKLDEFNKKLENKERNKKDLEEKNMDNEKLGKDIDHKKKNLEEKKTGQEFKEFSELLERKKQLEGQIKAVEDALFHDLSDMEKALKKYSKIAFEKTDLIEKYISDAASALHVDDDLSIVKILDGLKKSARDDKLGLDDKRKEKTINKIESLGQEYFSELQKKYKESKKGLKEIVEKIDRQTVKKEIEELEQEIGRLSKKLEHAVQEIEELGSDISKVNIEDMKKELETFMNSQLEDRVVIK